MPLSIRSKLFLVLLLATTAVVIGMYAFMLWSLERGFMHFVESRQEARIEALVERLGEQYARDGGWTKLRGDRRRWVQILMEERMERRIKHKTWLRGGFHGPASEWPPHPPEQEEAKRYVPLPFRAMLLGADRSLIFGRPERVKDLTLHAIEREGQAVGYLGVLPGLALNELGEIQFLERQGKSFVIIAALMVLFSAALALPLASTLVRPLKRITAASKALALGRYDTRVTVQSSDELGRLARDFNELAHALEKTEHNRRQWVADISHELRTPLSVLRGELEALQDGVRPLSRAAIDSLHSDVMRLSRLVEDLYQLSMADFGALSYRKALLDPVEVLEDDLKALEGEFHRRGIDVVLDDRLERSATLYGDADRLSQLFRNLLNNTLRYTEDGGALEIHIDRKASNLLLDFLDSAPGVPERELPRLFERFYRVETSRSRDLGGAGLGLALCRKIVEAHNGRISARSSPLGGLGIRIELPLEPSP